VKSWNRRRRLLLGLASGHVGISITWQRIGSAARSGMTLHGRHNDMLPTLSVSAGLELRGVLGAGLEGLSGSSKCVNQQPILLA
jgi:hypothetical protein